MNREYVEKIADEFGLKPSQVEAAAGLLAEGSTVPFIARYRKELTGSMDEVAITHVRDRMAQLEELDRRRKTILKSLKDQEKLTDGLTRKIEAAGTMTALEDIYLPFRPKRRTRGTMAKEKGLEPLAKILFSQDDLDPSIEAAPFVDPETGVESIEDALSGARDIITEWINEDQKARALMRSLFEKSGIFSSKVAPDRNEEGEKFRDYFDWQEPVSIAPSHRILAMRRGEKEGFLSLCLTPPEEEALTILNSLFVKGESSTSKQVQMAVQDSYKRLLSHGMETEIRLKTKQRADEEAIKVFANNLRQLLLSPPLGQKNVLAIDPGFRTGCKVVYLNPQGKLMHADTIYPHLTETGRTESTKKIKDLCRRFDIDAIAIGNGTAGRETEVFIKGLSLKKQTQVVMVNESGASVYSASEAAREEFPDQDITVRGSVSIGRRLMDPLAELVKIDPKSIGVGQYQHDVDQRGLKKCLDDVVMSCVNGVGVELNTASRQLLSYVSGLGPQLAKNIISYRDEHGPFPSRKALKNVPRLGAKSFEQAAGFLRIRGGENPLDGSAVHPESYPVVKVMATDLGCSVQNLMDNPEKRKGINKKAYITETIGIPTLNDILEELAKPGRDPRDQFENVVFAEGVEKMEDLKSGMKLPGIVTNITAFGAFVDIGVHQDGLIHVSQLADRFVKDPNEVLKVHQKVMVRVLGVELERKRISLSMKENDMDAGGHPGAASDKESVKRPSKRLKSPRKASFNNPFSSALKGI